MPLPWRESEEVKAHSIELDQRELTEESVTEKRARSLAFDMWRFGLGTSFRGQKEIQGQKKMDQRRLMRLGPENE